MRRLTILAFILGVLLAASGLLAYQAPNRVASQVPSRVSNQTSKQLSSRASSQGRSRPIFGDDDEDSLPVNTGRRTEWTFARFHYDQGEEFGYRGFRRWAADYPKSDHQFVQGVRRLTRINTREAEQVVDANSDELFNWPWVFVEDAGAWHISDSQAAKLHEYLARGGFLMLDDTHGDYEWSVLAEAMQRIWPDHPIEELKDQEEIFHVLYDLDDRFQIPGTRYLWGGRRYTPDSRMPKWRGMRDDHKRLVVAICHNSDVGDAWEWADSPRYPEDAMAMAYRIGINFVIYGMTH